MARTKATIRRLSVVIRSDFRRRAIKPFKKKTKKKHTARTKNCKYKKKKNGKTIKTINVRRK